MLKGVFAPIMPPGKTLPGPVFTAFMSPGQNLQGGVFALILPPGQSLSATAFTLIMPPGTISSGVVFVPNMPPCAIRPGGVPTLICSPDIWRDSFPVVPLRLCTKTNDGPSLRHLLLCYYWANANIAVLHYSSRSSTTANKIDQKTPKIVHSIP